MSDIPDALEPLVEFDEEEDGTPVAVCDFHCGNVILIDDGGSPPAWWTQRGLFVTDRGEIASAITRLFGRLVRCPKCGTLVGFDENGRPYRIPFAKIVEALAHRDRALEWLGAQWGREKFFTEGDQWKGPRCDLCGRQTPTLRELYYGLEAIA